MSWQLIDQLPISRTARDQLRAFVDSSLDEYEKFTQAGQLTDDAGGLAGLTTAERLRGLEPETVAIITSAIKGESVADPGQLSAQYALRYFPSYLAHEQHNRLYPVDGMQSIPQAMVNQLPAGTVRLQAHVDRIAFDDETSSYTLTLASGPETIRAREVVVAVPAPITRQIVAVLPQWKDEALAMALMPGSTTLCITADVTGLPQIARWAFIAVTGRAFDAIINPHPVSPIDEDPATIAQFVCYGNSAGYRPDLVTDPAATEAWIEDFLAVAPDLRGRVIGATHRNLAALLCNPHPATCPSPATASGIGRPDAFRRRPPIRDSRHARRLQRGPARCELHHNRKRAVSCSDGEPNARPGSDDGNGWRGLPFFHQVNRPISLGWISR
jgi:hypothetical protein